MAAAALAEIASTDDKSVQRAGAIPLLVGLLIDGSPRGQEKAARALAVLVQDPETSHMAAGCVPPLVSLLRSGSVLGREAAATALLQLSRHPHYAREIVDAGAVDLIVRRLSDDEGQGATGQGATSQAEGSGSSHGDSSHGDSSRDVKSGRSRISRENLDGSSSTAQRRKQQAATTLRHLAKDCHARMEIRKHGAIKPLVRLMLTAEAGCRYAMATFCYTPAVLPSSLRTSAPSAPSAPSARSIARRLPPSLAPQFHRPSSRCRQQAAAALANLAGDPDIGVEIVEAGAIPLFVELLHEASTISVLAIALRRP